MTLDDVRAIVPIEIRRQGSFATPGLLADPQPDMLVFLEDRQFLGLLRRTPEVSCVIAAPDLAEELGQIPGLAVASDPRRVLFDFHNHLARHTQFYWSDFPTEVDPAARVHSRAFIAERNVRIGPHTTIGPNTTILERCSIGASVVVRPGVVLGSVGFQSTRFNDAVVDMIHAGGIQIDDHVEVMSNAVVAAAVFRQTTRIGEGSKVGNLAFVSHNVQVGPRSFIGHGAVINGNVRIGQNVWIGPGATLVQCISVGDGARVSLGSTVIEDVSPGQQVTGNIAIEHRRFLRHVVSIR